MVMKCQVLLNNELVTVVQFMDKQIQLPSIHRKADVVNVKLDDNGNYCIVEDGYLEKQVDVEKTNKPKKKGVKKTTINEEAIEEADLAAEEDE